MIEGISGFLVFVVMMFVIVFVISLIGRATNTTFVTRGGTKIEPFMTKKEREKEKEDDEAFKWMIKRNNTLNNFCQEFSIERRKNPEVESDSLKKIKNLLVTESFYRYDSIDILSNIQLSEEASKIEKMGNATFVVDNYNKIKQLLESNVIEYEQYYSLGKQIYIQAISQEKIQS